MKPEQKGFNVPSEKWDINLDSNDRPVLFEINKQKNYNSPVSQPTLVTFKQSNFSMQSIKKDKTPMDFMNHVSEIS